jgi:arylsulfatase A-like enzyme
LITNDRKVESQNNRGFNFAAHCTLTPDRARCTAAGLLLPLLAAHAAARRPHVFLLYVDDWGWANVGFHREVPSKEVVTPAIDAIVQEGVQLNRMYAFPFCAPSRAALMSGRLPRHSNPQNIRGATYNANFSYIGGQGVPRNQTTLSQMLTSAGYWGAFAGKWDVGFTVWLVLLPYHGLCRMPLHWLKASGTSGSRHGGRSHMVGAMRAPLHTSSRSTTTGPRACPAPRGLAARTGR